MRWLAALCLIASACGRIGFDAGGGGGGPNGDGGPLADARFGSTTVAPLFPINGADWSSYVTNAGGGGTVATRPDAPCASTAGYFGCLHGGELRTFVAEGARVRGPDGRR